MADLSGLADGAPPPPPLQPPAPTELMQSAHAALLAAIARNDPAAAGVALSAVGGPGSDVLLALLATDGHAALSEAAHEASWHTVDVGGVHRPHGRAVRVLRAVLDGYGSPGAVLHALRAAGRDAATGASLIDGAFASPAGAAAAALVVAAGGLGSDGARALLADGDHLALRCYLGLKRFFDASGGCLSALLKTYGEGDDATALEVIGRWAAGPPLSLPGQNAVERNSRLALLIARTPAAWAPGARYPARALLSPDVRGTLALPVLLALRQLPPGVGQLVLGHLRSRAPWLLLSARVALGAAAAPPPRARGPLPRGPLLSLQTQRAMALAADPSLAAERDTLCRLQGALSSFERRRVAQRQSGPGPGPPPLSPDACPPLILVGERLQALPRVRRAAAAAAAAPPEPTAPSQEECARAYYHGLQLQQPAATAAAAAAAAALAADGSDGDEPRPAGWNIGGAYEQLLLAL
jgi:hypothetical protein